MFSIPNTTYNNYNLICNTNNTYYYTYNVNNVYYTYNTNNTHKAHNTYVLTSTYTNYNSNDIGNTYNTKPYIRTKCIALQKRKR